MRLKDKVAIVTGGASGLGRGIAHCMAKEGATLVIADIQYENAETVVKELEALNPEGRHFAAKVDITNRSDISAIFAGVLSKAGQIDILVNNVGVSGRPGMPFSRQTEEDWDLVFDVNVKSVYRTAKALTPYFIERRSGKIINMASIAAFMPGLMKPAYSVSKMAVATFTRILAKELAPYGVNVNAISPGLIWTPLWERLADQLMKIWPEEYANMTPRQIFEKRVSELVPLGREQTPEDIGWTAVFLASDEARNITGQVIGVDGGVIMH